MKILIRNSDHVVVYARPDLQLDAIEASGTGWRDPNFSTANATLTDANLPADWAGSVWTYISGVWAIHDPVQHAINQAASLAAMRTAMTCTPWQIRKALNAMSLRAAVEGGVAASDQTTKDAWQYATEFCRLDPLLISLGVALGKTAEELDALFELALSL